MRVCLGAFGCLECYPHGALTPPKRKIDFDDDDDAVMVEAAECVEVTTAAAAAAAADEDIVNAASQ